MSARLIVVATLLVVVGRALALAPDGEKVAPGVRYHKLIRQASGPVVVHVLAVEQARDDLLFDLVVGQGRLRGACLRVEELASADAPRGYAPLAAVNAGFFDEHCAPVGALGGRGELWQERDKSWVVAGITDDGRLLTGNSMRIQVRLDLPGYGALDLRLNRPLQSAQPSLWLPVYGALPATPPAWHAVLRGPVPTLRDDASAATVVSCGTATLDGIPADGMVLAATGAIARKLRDKVAAGGRATLHVDIDAPAWRKARCLVMGAGWLLRDGAPDREDWSRYGETFRGPQPRTVLAAAGDELLLVVVDGRQSGHSVGLSFDALATLLRDDLGAREAVNLDGGGSSTLWIDGRVVNCPSDRATLPCTGQARGVNNALVLYRRVH